MGQDDAAQQLNFSVICPTVSLAYLYTILPKINILSNMQKQNLFRLTQPCQLQHNRHSSPSFLNNSLIISNKASPKQSQLKYRYLHRLDVQSIDKKYELLERLNRITRIQGTNYQGLSPSHHQRDKQYSIESYYIFSEGEQIQRRYQPHRNTLLRQRGNQNIHLKALTAADMLKHQLKEHRQFIEKFKPKRATGPPLAKKFRMSRNSHLRISQPF